MNSHRSRPTISATRVRYGVVALAVLLAMVTYLDRACIATLAPHIMRDLDLSKDQMSVIYSAFALAYAAFEIPTAWWGDLFGGVTTDAVTKRFGLRLGRAGVGAAAYVLAGGAMILAGVVTQPALAAWLIAVALGASMFTLGASWSTCLDIGGGHAGVVSAAMNTSGQLGSVLSPLMVTFLLKQLGDWNAPLFVMGGLFLVGAVCWALINPNKRIFD